MWLLNATTRTEGTMGRMQATVDGLQGQLDRIEGKIDKIEGEVRGHGKWIHTLQVFAAAVLFVLGWVFVNAVWPWLKQKIGIP